MGLRLPAIQQIPHCLLPADLHSLLGSLAKTVLAVGGQSTDLDCAHGQLTLSNLHLTLSAFNARTLAVNG